MADEKIEVEIVLDDGSIVKGFAKINSEAEKSAKTVERSLGGALRRPLNTSGIDRSLSRITSGVFNFRNALIGAVGILGGAALVRSFAEAASVQQDAVNALNNSLRTAGTFSEEASQGFQDFASGLQAVSTFGDEVILQQAALARNFTSSNEEAQKLTKAAVELSAATGISLDSAVKNLGKTFAGLAGEIGESVPAIRNLTAEQLKAGEALDLVLTRFGGSALSQTRTFSGALQQLQNTFGDLFEEIGAVITNSPVIVSLFNALSQTLANIGKSLQGNNLDDFFKNLVLGAAGAVNAIIDTFDFLNKIPDFFRFVFLKSQIETSKFVNSFLKTIEPVSGFIDRIFGDAGASARNIQQNANFIAGLEKELEALGQSSIQTGQGFEFARAKVDEFTTAFINGIGSAQTNNAEIASPAAPLVEAVDKDLLKLRNKVLEAQNLVRGDLERIFLNPEDVIAENDSLFSSLADKSTADLKRIQDGLTQLKQGTIAEATQIQQAAVNGIGRGIASGISAAVTAMQNGQNAISAFAKAFIGILGDLAIQLGTQLIVSGLGLQQLFALNPAGAIAFGAGLVAIGTLLKSFAGGGGGASIPSGQDSVASPVLDSGGDTGDGIQDPGSRVAVTIQGDVLDSDETGLRIADIIKEQGFQNATVT